MATKSNKHANAEQKYYGDFSGGLNLSLPAERLAANEMQLAENFEYDAKTGALKLRAGLVLMGTLPSPVRDLAPVAGADAVLVRCDDNKLYRLDTYSLSGSLGVLAGDGRLSSVSWGDDSEVVLCTGAKLYHYDGSVLAVVSESPLRNDFCFVRAGRLCVVDSSTDSISYSGVGDIHNWKFASDESGPWTDADALSLEVGYKDGCDLAAVAPLTSDLVVFKRPKDQPGLGKVYRVTGEYPDWQVKEHSSGSSAWNDRAWATTTNDLLFITAEGVASLGTVSDYGDIKMQWAGAKVNPRISREVGPECCMWKMGSHSQVWVRAKASETLWVYSYGVGSGGAWTTFRFPGVVADACTTGTNRYVAIGSQIFQLDENFGTDNGQPFTGRIRMQGIRKLGMMVIKQVYVAYTSMAASEAKLVLEGYRLRLPLGGQLGDMAALDSDVAALDDDPLLSATSAAMRTRVNIRLWDATAEFEVTRGPFTLTAVGLEVAEV